MQPDKRYNHLLEREPVFRKIQYGKAGSKRFIVIPRSKKILQLTILLASGVFLAEVLAMIVVWFYTGPYIVTILLDAIITTTLMIPLIYGLSYRPLLQHIAEQERVEMIMRVRLRLMQYAVDHSMDELMQLTLDEVEALTGSTISFFHFLDSDQEQLSLQAWSTNTLKSMCKAEGKGSHYPVEEAGIWADCIRQRQPVIHNDYASLPYRKGTPEGHAAIIRELTVPIQRDGRIVAILGIGNKPQDYISSDVELVSSIADFAWDTIERKQSEDALRESEQKFRTLVTWTYDWEQWVDPQGYLVYNSPACIRISGYRPEEFIQNPSLFLEIVHPDDRQLYEKHMLHIHDETTGVNNVEFRIIARDGSDHWIDHICRPLFGEDKRYLGRRVSNRDITVRKLTEQEIQERNEKEIMLTQTIHTMQMEIARDLHDTIGQNISYLRMKLDHLSEKETQAQVDMESEITNMLKAADETYNLIRGTLAVLQSGGLADPLALFIQYANQIEERTLFEVKVSSQGEPRPLLPNQARQLFFVFREALSNIEKHADARNVSVELIWGEDDMELTISDDGNGFHAENMPVGGHYGLKFMKERVESLKGMFLVLSGENSGTRVIITLPYS